MTDPITHQAEIDQTAAQWVVRSQAVDLHDRDLMALIQWLEASDQHAAAYDRALRLWADIDTAVIESQIEAPQAAPVHVAEVISLADWRAPKSEPKKKPRALSWMVGSGAAAAIAAVLFVALMPMTPAQVYETAKGQKQTLTLADGSVLNLNTDTRISVRLLPHGRQLQLEKGEVALKVIHDDKRPLVLKTGDMTITDIGTEFNVRRVNGTVDVAVREGVVSIDSGAAVLKRGDRIARAEGGARTTLSRIDPDEAFAWQTAHAIYRNEPLSEVVKDLNRYYDKPFIVDDQSGNLRLTAILTLDSESAVAERLEDFLPVKARSAKDGAIHLSRTVSAVPAVTVPRS